MVSFEDLEKLFRHTVDNDPTNPGRGFVNLEIDGEIVYQYIGDLHNFTKVDIGEFSEVKDFVDSLDNEVMEAEEPNDDAHNPKGNIMIEAEESAEADIELLKNILNHVHFSLSDIDDAYFPIDEKEDIRPEDVSK